MMGIYHVPGPIEQTTALAKTGCMRSNYPMERMAPEDTTPGACTENCTPTDKVAAMKKLLFVTCFFFDSIPASLLSQKRSLLAFRVSLNPVCIHSFFARTSYIILLFSCGCPYPFLRTIWLPRSDQKRQSPKSARLRRRMHLLSSS